MAWKDLTEREKYLDKGISKYGGEDSSQWRRLFNTKKTTIDRIMDFTGAESHERNFIISRIELRVKTLDLLETTDDKINDVSIITSHFDKDLKGWDKKFWEGYLNCTKDVTGAECFSIEELREKVNNYYNISLEEFANKYFNMTLKEFIKKYL